MPHIAFGWDRAKDSLNQKKHGVSFDEARTVFVDENALLIHDPDHSGGEDRFILLGLSAASRLLLVCHSYRENDETIRIISTRKAARTERRHYWERRSR
ncbi:MAG: BrnT family toxin [Deltaproteobacteria bacterium]|nr:BrnT family toxin [Deltaproteobacteria bacterium]